jgi:hypothetical protein
MRRGGDEMETIDYLRRREWSMGCGGSENNGQCPECCGVHEGWHGHPCHTTSDTIGHKKSCKLANALKDLGEDVVFLGDYKSDIVYETYWDENGLLGMRIKSNS